MESILSNWRICFLFGFVTGFLFSLWLLNIHFTACFKKYRDEMNKQYIKLLQKNKIVKQ